MLTLDILKVWIPLMRPIGKLKSGITRYGVSPLPPQLQMQALPSDASTQNSCE
ncbi:hypothetical protein SAMN05216167_14112 [Spirosoma endophyticum]|uniref:Uncharacterized protein n=1 Tax=Spirosoma endophyticum TaxID=662367 RepID=A0A1I2HDV9_9BACT|nr:hypothetical protein SAMN05216167_14112 [Spirosoma endophyticum]